MAHRRARTHDPIVIRSSIVCLQVGKEVAHPGVSNDFGDFAARKYYTYYQWVCFVFFFQVGGLPLSVIYHTCDVAPRSRIGMREERRER